jgi:hypothetical protein
LGAIVCAGIACLFQRDQVYSSTNMRAALVTVLILVATAVTRADLVASYDFTGNTGKEDIEPPFFAAPNVAASVLSHGDGVSADPLAPPTAADSIVVRNWVGPEPDDYFSFTLTPTNGSSIEITSIDAGVIATNGGPTSAVLRSSLDGFTSDLGEVPVTLAHVDRMIDLSMSSLVFNSPVEFRIIGLGATSNGATFGLTSAGGAAGLRVNGTVTPAAVPEPSAGLLLALTLSIGCWRCRATRRPAAAKRRREAKFPERRPAASIDPRVCGSKLE